MRWPPPHAVLVPLQCEFFALEGLAQLLQTVEQIRAPLNPELADPRRRADHVRPRNNLSDQVVDDVRAFMGDKVYKTMIPRNVRVVGGAVLRQAGPALRLQMLGSQAYLQLASEVIERERRSRAA